MIKKNAIITLNIGEKYLNQYNRYFKASWDEYCANHNLSLINISELLDTSIRAKGRSPAWQKLLVSDYIDKTYVDRLAWVDSDVMIRPDAPNIFDYVPRDKIGVVDEFQTPSRDEYESMIESLYNEWDAKKVGYIKNKTPKEYYLNFGIDCDFDNVVQTGVMVFDPILHSSIFKFVYDNYEEGKYTALNHEMRPLSYEIIRNNLAHWITPRFNMQWPIYRQIYYPFLSNPNIFKIGPFSMLENVRRVCVKNAFGNNYFLHFTGKSDDFKFVG